MKELDIQVGEKTTIRIVRNEDGLSIDLWVEGEEEPRTSEWYANEDLP